jgi:adenylate kinase
VILLAVDATALIERLSGRFTCKTCGEGYHDRFRQPAKAGVCDKCGGAEFLRRADDRAEAVAVRLEVYDRQTAPILPYYRAKGILRQVDAMADIEKVSREIKEILAHSPTHVTAAAARGAGSTG